MISKRDSNVILVKKRGRKGYDVQLALSYIAYMMVGSGFDKCEISSERAAERMRFEYMKMPASDQYEMEEIILEWMDKADFFRSISDLRCKVYVWGDTDFCLSFETYFEELTIKTTPMGVMSFSITSH